MERRRLELLDDAAPRSPHRPAPAGPASWQLGRWTITGVAESVPFALLGVALVPVLAYLVGLAAAGQRAVAHALLGDRSDRFPAGHPSQLQ